METTRKSHEFILLVILALSVIRESNFRCHEVVGSFAFRLNVASEWIGVVIFFSSLAKLHRKHVLVSKGRKQQVDVRNVNLSKHIICPCSEIVSKSNYVMFHMCHHADFETPSRVY